MPELKFYREISLSTDDDSELERLLPGVRRLHSDRINPYRQRPRSTAAPAPRRSGDLGSASAESTGQGFGARDSHFNSGLQTRLQRKIRQGAMRPQAALDLHGYRQDEALQALQDFFANALHRRYRLVLVIHGQGYRSQTGAVLKPMLQRWLSQQPQVLGWCPAQPRDGAGGASYVYLRAD